MVVLSTADYQRAVEEHAKFLGMDPEVDKDLLWWVLACIEPV